MSPLVLIGRRWIMIGAVMGFLGVALGAFGAHGLSGMGFLEKFGGETRDMAGFEVPASYKYLADFNTGVRYHMYHALALVLVGLFSQRVASRAARIAGCCFLWGIVLFSGSLYILVIGGPRWLGIPWGMVAPIGGTLFLVGWLSFAAGACCGPPRTEPDSAA